MIVLGKYFLFIHLLIIILFSNVDFYVYNHYYFLYIKKTTKQQILIYSISFFDTYFFAVRISSIHSNLYVNQFS